MSVGDRRTPPSGDEFLEGRSTLTLWFEPRSVGEHPSSKSAAVAASSAPDLAVPRPDNPKPAMRQERDHHGRSGFAAKDPSSAPRELRTPTTAATQVSRGGMIGRLSPPARRTKVCPACAEVILASARKCKHCHEWLGEKPRRGQPFGRFLLVSLGWAALATASSGLLYSLALAAWRNVKAVGSLRNTLSHAILNGRPYTFLLYSLLVLALFPPIVAAAGYERTARGYGRAAITSGALAVIGSALGGPILAVHGLALAMGGFIAVELPRMWRVVFLAGSGFALGVVCLSLPADPAAFHPLLDLEVFHSWNDFKGACYVGLLWTPLFVSLLASSAFLLAKATRRLVLEGESAERARLVDAGPG